MAAADATRRGLHAKLLTLFNLVPVAIAIFDEDFRYESVNPAYCALTGYAAEELLGKAGDTYLVIESEPLDAQTAAHPETGERWTRELRFEKKDGSVAEVEWQIAKESRSGVRILVATDVTELHRAAAAREGFLLASERAARTEAEHSNRLNEEFLATLSHELRNPLNAILGWSTLLSRKPNLPDAVMHGLKAIERNSRLQAQMISDLQDYAGITSGKMRLVAETMDPYPVIRAALDVIAGPAEAAGVTLRTSFADESLSVEADPTRLQQIVWNLLSNAVKFSAEGGEVVLEAGRSGDCLVLVVTDAGRGIEPDLLPRIFERFSPRDATITRSHAGLGLGLTIVKQLADLHGGSIHAFSAGKGTGARFTVKIPLSQ